MCGIAGIVGYAKTDTTTALEKMSAAVAHRGPDDIGLFAHDGPCGKVGLAFRRLAIIDVSARGHQPMVSDDGRYAVVFNGEIYNFRELRNDIARDGRPFRTQTDTEVLLRLFEAEGPKCLSKLRGMFAFAIHDGATGDVFAARDRLGIKPFYYHASAQGLVFASEVRALLASGLMRRTLDLQSLDAYLSFGAVQQPRTIVNGISSLNPGHVLRVTGDGAISRLERYWQLPLGGRSKSSDVVATVRADLNEGVRSQMEADVPLGAFLSGGMDSGAIVALMSRHAPGRVHTFNVSFEHDHLSEHAVAKKVAQRWSTTHVEMCLTEAEALTSLPHALADIDQPTIDGINTWFVSRAVRQAGATVALSGIGGDELFGGYPSFSRVPRMVALGAPVGFLPPTWRGRVAHAAEKMMGHSLTSQKVSAAVSDGADLLSSYLSVRGLFAESSRQQLLNGHRPANDGAYALPVEARDVLQGADTDDTFNGVAACELQLYAGNMLLRDTDAMSMAHALEVRVPFLDEHLVETMCRLPGKAKRGPRRKNLLAEALGDDLLPEALEGPKKGFTLPFEHWLRGGLKPCVEEVLGDAPSVRAAGLNQAAALDVWHRFSAGSSSTSWSRVWGLVVLVDWCRRHGVEV